MKALKPEGKAHEVIEIENTLEALQKVVGTALIVGVNGEEFTDIPDVIA